MTEAEVLAQLQEAGIHVTALGHYVAEIDFARSLGKGLRTVQLWREKGIGPEHKVVVGRVCYSCAAIAAWLTDSDVTSRKTMQRPEA